jgi:hypothetical protein
MPATTKTAPITIDGKVIPVKDSAEFVSSSEPDPKDPVVPSIPSQEPEAETVVVDPAFADDPAEKEKLDVNQDPKPEEPSEEEGDYTTFMSTDRTLDAPMIINGKTYLPNYNSSKKVLTWRVRKEDLKFFMAHSHVQHKRITTCDWYKE